MCIPLNHRQGFPPAKVFDREQVDALHGESRGEAVPKVVKPKIFDLGLADGRRNGFLAPPEVSVTLAVREDENSPVQRTREPSQNGPHP